MPVGNIPAGPSLFIQTIYAPLCGSASTYASFRLQGKHEIGRMEEVTQLFRPFIHGGMDDDEPATN
jgi:hypothetical protein